MAAWVGLAGWVGDAAWVGTATPLGVAELFGFADSVGPPVGEGLAEVPGSLGTAVGLVLDPSPGSALGCWSGGCRGCRGCSGSGERRRVGGSTQPAAYETPIPPKTTAIASAAAGAMTRKRLRTGAGRGAVRESAASLPTSSSSVSGSSTDARSARRTSEREGRRVTG